MGILCKSIFWFALGLLFSINLKAQSDYKTYYEQLEKQYKKESLGYKIANGFELNPGFSKYVIGFSRFTKLGSNEKQNLGLHYRNSHLEASVFNFTNAVAENSLRWSIGYFRPIRHFAIGKRIADVKGALLQPVYGLGLVVNKGKSVGLYVSPGVHLQLPFVVASARLNTDFNFGQGVSVVPEISFQLDALRNLLNPSLTKTGEGTTTSTSVTPLGGGWYMASSSTSSYDMHIKDIGPFWSITPRYGFMPAVLGSNNYNGQLRTLGIGVSGRINFLGADIKYTQGASTFKDLELKDAPTEMKDFDYTKVEGYVRTNEFSFEGNVNVVGLVLNLVSANYMSMPMTTTPLNRLQFHLGFTHFSPQSTHFVSATSAKTYTDSFFTANPNVERNTTTDPFQTKKEWGVSYGLTYEMGVVGIGVMNKLTKSMGRASFVEVYYMIPISKVAKVYGRGKK